MFVNKCIDEGRKNESCSSVSVFRDTMIKFKIDQSRRKLENCCNFTKIQLNVVIVRIPFLKFSINVVPSDLYWQW